MVARLIFLACVPACLYLPLLTNYWGHYGAVFLAYGGIPLAIASASHASVGADLLMQHRAALFLAGFMKLEGLRSGPAWDWNPLLVLGQTALFFYMLHFILLGASAQILAGGMRMRGLPETYLMAAIVVVVLYPVCGAYRAYKRAHPRGFAQYI